MWDELEQTYSMMTNEVNIMTYLGFQSFILSTNTDCQPGAVGNTSVNKTDKIPWLHGPFILLRETINNPNK